MVSVLLGYPTGEVSFEKHVAKSKHLWHAIKWCHSGDRSGLDIR